MPIERFMEILSGILNGGSPSVVGGDDIFTFIIINIIIGGVLMLIVSILVIMTLPLFLNKNK